MNKFTKAIILGTVALTTLASTLEVAAAGDANWRNRGWRGHQGWRYHNGPGWRHGGVAAGIIGGLAAGVIVGEALQPRVYRERPGVVVDEGPVYDDPDADYDGPVAGYDPDDQESVRPRDHRRMDQSQRDDQDQGDDQGQMDDQAQDDGYFPDRPQKQHHRTDSNNDVAQQGALEPWTAQWRSYCKQRFSSFNATTGTYKGYDGKSHFCTSG